MSVARVTELSAISEQGFEDAIERAIAHATKTLRGVGVLGGGAHDADDRAEHPEAGTEVYAIGVGRQE